MKYVIQKVILLFFMLILIVPTALAVEPIGSWSSTSALPDLLASHGSFLHGNKVFVVGGANTVVIPTNLSSIINNTDGTLSSWLASGSLLSVFWHSLVKKDNHVYILGGATFPPTTTIDLVRVGSIDGSDAISSWNNLNPLPKSLAQGAVAITGNRIYFAGGFTQAGGPFTTNQDIYFADINPDGTIGSWTNAGLLPMPSFGHGFVEHNNRLFLIGGRNLVNGYFNKTYSASINPDGTIAAWQETSTLSQASYRSGVVKVGSQIIVLGGEIGGISQDDVYFADINPDGTLSPWSASLNVLPQAICCGAAVATNSHIYMIGGFGGSYLNTVYFSEITNGNPSDINLPVPYFSQNSLPWGPSEYDHAGSLGFSNTTVDRWGCAVTSAAMVMKYHGMSELSDGTSLDPGSLNTWLKNNRGYQIVRGKNGADSWLDWTAVTRLSKQLFDDGKSNVKLMHKRAYPSDSTTTLLNDDLLNKNIPDILKVKNNLTNSHFAVAKGIQSDVYLLNDPEWDYPDISSFNNEYFQVDRFIPSQTNFSYLVVISNPEVEILVTDQNGNKTGKIVQGGTIEEFSQIPNAIYAFEESISNPNDQNIPENLGIGVNVFLLPEPGNGDYDISVSAASNEPYVMNISTIQEEGSQIFSSIAGNVASDSADMMTLPYSQTEESMVIKEVTVETTIDDIHTLSKLGAINKLTMAKLMVMLRLSNVNFPLLSKEELYNNFEDLIEQERGGKISEDAYQVLLYDIKSLKSQL